MTAASGGFIARFIHHRVAANLLMGLLVLSGLWAASKLNTQFFPNFALDIITVRIAWSGASAEDVERAITIPLEQELRNVDGLHRLSSTSATGVAAITLEFEEHTDMGEALDSVNERVALVRNLPADAEKPQISRIIRYEPVARLALSSSAGLEELRPLAHRIKDELLAQGIAKITLSGLPEEEIAIEVPSLRLHALDLTLGQLAQLIDQHSRDLPAGQLGEAEVSRQLRSLQQARDPLAFAALPLVQGDDGRLLRLGDVAHIERRNRDGQVELFIDGQPAVELLLQRNETSDALEAAAILNRWLEQNRQRLPDSVKLHVYNQSWQLIEERIGLLLKNGLGGLLLVIAILFLFLNGRIAFWVTVGIPVSFLTTLIILYLSGGSINMISLFGLIMAVGIIVDDAIVVAEQAQSNHQQGLSPARAAEASARRMLAPVVSSSLTTVAAFLPLMLIGGVVGNILFQIPLVIICVVLASLLECFLILPAHLRAALGHELARQPARYRQWLDQRFNRFRDGFFLRLVSLAIRHRGTTLAATVALLILSIGLVAGGRIGFTFFPNVEGKILYANASFTAGTPRERVQAFLQHLETTLRQTEAEFGGGLVEISLSQLGITRSGGGSGQRRGDAYGSLFVELVSPDHRQVSNAEFIRAWERRIQKPAELELFALSQRNTGPPGQDLDLRLIGDSPHTLKAAAAELMAALATYPGVSAIEDDLPWGQDQLVYRLTPTGQALGLSIDDVGHQLRAAYDGIGVQIFAESHDEVEVRLRLPEHERRHLSDLDHFQLRLPQGGFAPLASVVALTSQRGFEALRHSDGQLTVRVSADVDRRLNNSNRILAQLQRDVLPGLMQRYGISYRLEGRASDQAETLADMKAGSLYALLLIYLILAWVFASYSQPLVIMAAIPFGLIGAIGGHYLMGLELTILSLFGIVGLSGIVVNDAIILISFYQQLRRQGLAAQQAIVEASCQRLRPVLLTSLTTIAGLTPLLFETSLQAQFLIPMAAAIVFGLAFATVLVLLVIPAGLALLTSLQSHQPTPGQHTTSTH